MPFSNLGIPSTGFEYQKLSKKQDPAFEYKKTLQFLKKVIFDEIPTKISDLISAKPQLQFINYGDTQLVFVLSLDDKKHALLVGQPSLEYGTVKSEFENLQRLSNIMPGLIVKPEYYFSDEDRELYMAPYLLQARCIASQNTGWGIYIPEPYYRFEHFSPEEQYLVNTVIVANLVRLYDEKENMGIASCKIGGGDFILEKEWDFDKTLDNTFKRMKLIAAREMIKVSLDEYINLIKKEFLLNTYYKTLEERNLSIIINHKSRVPMTNEEIERGIQLGLNFKGK